MGFDQTLIFGEIDEELFCPICADVLEEPMQSAVCEHAFCRKCIEIWTAEKQICPVDRTELVSIFLVPVPRLMRTMLGRLKIKCIFAENGCTEVMPLEEFRGHLANCQNNPIILFVCNKGCGMKLTKDELSKHQCDQKLMTENTAVAQLKNMQVYQERHLQELQRLLELLESYIVTLRAIGPLISTLNHHLDVHTFMQWGGVLPLATVHTWGSLISTPDTPLRAKLLHGLHATDCPVRFMQVLVNGCQEDHWPPGLINLETRRLNMNRLAQFETRLLPIEITEKPCVVILAADNVHMSDYLRPMLGMVMIFLDGVYKKYGEPEIIPNFS